MGICAVLSGDVALVWVWDQGKIDAAISVEQAGARNIRYLPETLLTAPPEADSQRLVTCLDGVEGQAWASGSLVASRWWSALPDQAAWQAFLRDAGYPGSTSFPSEPINLEMQAHPWLSPIPLAAAPIWRHESWVVWSVFVILMAMLQWSLFGWWQSAKGIEQLKQRQEQVELNAKPVQEARSEALDLKGKIDYLCALTPYPPLVLVLAEVSRLTPKDGTTYIREWDYQNGRLKVLFGNAKGELPASAYVKNFQESGWFKDVQSPSASERNSLGLEMNVQKSAELNPELLSEKKKTTEPTVDPSVPLGTQAKLGKT